MEPIKIVIADDHHFLRTAWKIILEHDPNFVVVADAGTGEEAAAAVVNTAPDIVLMDVSMPVMDGLKATQILSCLMPGVKILGVSASTDPVLVRQFLDAGAVGYVSKYARAAELKEAVLATAAGQRWICPHVTQKFMEALPELEEVKRVRPLLSGVEAMVAQLARQAIPAPAICQQLQISETELAQLKINVGRKLGLHRNPRLAATIPALN